MLVDRSTLVKETDWYPKKSMSAAERLAFYASRFAIAEADSTYYFPPSPQLAKGWSDRTPKDFTMNVKAYSLLTGHPAKPNSLWPDLREAIRPEFAGKRNVYLSHLPSDAEDEVWVRFRYAIRPLQDSGKLGAVLMQYPEWFTAKRANRDELAAIRDGGRTSRSASSSDPRPGWPPPTTETGPWVSCATSVSPWW